MKENNKKILSVICTWILGGLMLFPFMPILDIVSKIVSHRNYIQNNLDKSFHFDTLVLDASIFSSFADKREIKIDGNTYDVYQMHRLSGDKIQIIAFKDNLEDRMLQEITNLFENQDKGSSKIKLLTCPDWCFHSIEQKKSPGINWCKQEFNYLPLSGKEINLSYPHPPDEMI